MSIHVWKVRITSSRMDGRLNPICTQIKNCMQLLTCNNIITFPSQVHNNSIRKQCYYDVQNETSRCMVHCKTSAGIYPCRHMARQLLWFQVFNIVGPVKSYPQRLVAYRLVSLHTVHTHTQLVRYKNPSVHFSGVNMVHSIQPVQIFLPVVFFIQYKIKQKKIW